MGGATLARGGSGRDNCGWVGVRFGRDWRGWPARHRLASSGQDGRRTQRAFVDRCGRSRGGGPGELARHARARQPGAALPQQAVRIASATDVGSAALKYTAALLATSRSTGSSEHATGTPRAIASSTAGRSPRSGSGSRRPPRRRRGTRGGRGRRRRAGGRRPPRRPAPRGRGGRRVGAVAGEREHGAPRPSAATPSISAARFLCGRSEATLRTSGRSPWPTSAGGGGSAGRWGDAVGDDVDVRCIPSSLARSAADACETVMTPPRASGGGGDEHAWVPSRIAVGTASAACSHSTSWTVSTLGGPPASGPKFATPCRRSRWRAARGSPNSSPIAHEPRATPEEPTRTTCAASSQKPAPVVSRLTSAVSSRSGRSGDEAAHQTRARRSRGRPSGRAPRTTGLGRPSWPGAGSQAVEVGGHGSVEVTRRQ